jgi:hypothetical protein
VRVGVHRHPDLGVPEHFHDRPGRDSRGHHQARRLAAPLARRQRPGLPLSGPPGARRADAWGYR